MIGGADSVLGRDISTLRFAPIPAAQAMLVASRKRTLGRRHAFVRHVPSTGHSGPFAPDDWTDRPVNLNVDRQWAKDSPTYDASTTVDRSYDKHFHHYYGDGSGHDRP